MGFKVNDKDPKCILCIIYRLCITTKVKFNDVKIFWTHKQIQSNPKILFYTMKDISKEDNGIFLKMDDALKIYSGHLFRRDSEFLPIFRHYILKGFETGIFKRIHTTMREQSYYAQYNRVRWHSMNSQNDYEE